LHWFLFLTISSGQVCALLGPYADDLLAGGENIKVFFADNPGSGFKAWRGMYTSPDPGIKALRTDLSSLQRYNDLVRNNNLRLDTDGISDILNAASKKGQAWDHPEAVLQAIARSSEANVSNLRISHKKFPEPGDGSDPFVLKNAKQYQKEASGDAGLSFDVNGTSFDNLTNIGKHVDRKYGHSAVFHADGTVKNNSRANSLLDQAERQINAVGGDASKLRWEISSTGGTNGITKLFLDNPRGFPGLEDLEVIHVPQQLIIP